MKKGDFVLYICHGTICVGKLAEKWSDERWGVLPLLDRKNEIKRHEKFLMPVSKLKNILDITKKI